MALYLISYDIAEKDAFGYAPLWRRLKEIGAAKILYSEWVIASGPNQSGTIYNEVSPLIQGKDRLLIQEMGRVAHWSKLMIADDAFREFVMRNARSLTG